jgi:hypothetical protein
MRQKWDKKWNGKREVVRTQPSVMEEWVEEDEDKKS